MEKEKGKLLNHLGVAGVSFAAVIAPGERVVGTIASLVIVGPQRRISPGIGSPLLA